MLLIGSFMVAVSKKATAELEGESLLEDLDLFLVFDGDDLEHALSVPGSGLGIEISHSVQPVLAGDLAVLWLQVRVLHIQGCFLIVRSDDLSFRTQIDVDEPVLVRPGNASQTVVDDSIRQ